MYHFLTVILRIFQYFEQDDPELYKTKIKFIAENDVDDMELTFAEEVYADGRLEKVNIHLSHLLL